MPFKDRVLSLNWNDIKVLLALSRHKRLTKAAQSLGISRVTIANRLTAIQEELGIQIFVQNENGFDLTKKGVNFIGYAEEIERQLILCFEKVKSDDHARPRVRIGVTEGLGENHLVSVLSQWLIDKAIDIDFVSLPKITKVSKREVDISITMEKPEGEYVIRRPLTAYALGIYASRDYLNSHSPIHSKDDLEDHAWIGYIDELLFAEELKYHFEISPNLDLVFRSTTIHAQKEAAKKGLGLSIIPYYMMQDEPDLIRVLPDFTIFRQYWISTNRDLHHFGTVRRVWDYLVEEITENENIFVYKSNS